MCIDGENVAVVNDQNYIIEMSQNKECCKRKVVQNVRVFFQKCYLNVYYLIT
jgi:hypothetical protein